MSKRTFLPLLLVALVAVAALPACGDGGSGGTPDGGTVADAPYSAFLRAEIALECQLAADCHFIESAAKCVAESPVQTATISARIAAGEIVFHPDAAAACLTDLPRYVGCSYSSELYDWQIRDESCHGILEGTSADGAACLLGAECQSGTCNRSPACDSGSACCEGSCVAAPAVVPLAGLGESCDGHRCAAAYVCAGDPKLCTTPTAEGQPCTNLFECERGTICRPVGADPAVQVCTHWALVGEACNPDDPAPCDRRDNICDSTTHVCTAVGSFGEPCGPGGGCSEQYAICKNQVCVTVFSHPGESCTADYECTAGRCVSGFCVIPAETVCPVTP